MYHHMTTASEKGKDGQLSKHDSEPEAHWSHGLMEFGCRCDWLAFFWELGESLQDSCLEDEVYKKSPLGWICVPGSPVAIQTRPMVNLL